MEGLVEETVAMKSEEGNDVKTNRVRLLEMVDSKEYQWNTNVLVEKKKTDRGKKCFLQTGGEVTAKKISVEDKQS